MGNGLLRCLVPYLAYAYSCLLRATTRVRFFHGEARAGLRARNERFIYAFWHQRQVFFTVTHRHDKLTILVSRSQDGEMIAETARLCGVDAVRGSSSRGASEAVRSMMTALRSGLDIGITPDGPKGPAREVKRGVLFLAQKLGVPILPVTSAQSHRFVFRKAWDHFHLPLPFGRGAVVYGLPIRVGLGDDLKAKAAELKASLDAITLEAEALVA